MSSIKVDTSSFRSSLDVPQKLTFVFESTDISSLKAIKAGVISLADILKSKELKCVNST